jgi:hypothetical protein
VGLVIGVACVVGALGLWLRAPASTSTTPPPAQRVLADVLDFPGATGWRPATCREAACAGAWTHDSGQQVDVVVLPVPDPARLSALADRLQAQVTGAGGRVDRLELAGGVLRMLRPVDDDARPMVLINYIITAPEQRALHVVSSLVPFSDQEQGDARVRDLLAFAAWVRVDGAAAATGS